MDKEQYELLYRLEEAHWWYVGMGRVVIALLQQYLSDRGPLRILDAGCGTGGMAKQLRRFGSVVGLDLSADALKLCRRRDLPCLTRASVESLPFADGSFDLLTSFDVLYHKAVLDDRQALQEFYRVIRPGGLLLLRVPAYDWLRGAHDVAVHTRHRYSHRELAMKLSAAGFRLHKLTHANTLLFPVAALKRLIEETERPWWLDLELPPAPVNRALLGVLSLEALLMRRLSFPWGLSLVAVAGKPLALDSRPSAAGDLLQGEPRAGRQTASPVLPVRSSGRPHQLETAIGGC